MSQSEDPKHPLIISLLSVDLSEKNEMVYRGRRYFGAKSKNYGATMKQAVKEHPLGISDIFRNKRIKSRREK